MLYKISSLIYHSCEPNAFDKDIDDEVVKYITLLMRVMSRNVIRCRFRTVFDSSLLKCTINLLSA